MRFLAILIFLVTVSGIGVWQLMTSLGGPSADVATARSGDASREGGEPPTRPQAAAPAPLGAGDSGRAQVGEAVRFIIQQGQTTGEIARELERAGLVRNATLFRVWVQWRGAEGKLQAGEYDLRRGMGQDELIEALQQAKAKDEPIRFLEGWRIEEMAEELERRELGVDAKRFVELARTPQFLYDFLGSLPPGASLEGYLFPDTYRVIPGKTTAEELVHAMLKRFGEALSPDLREEARRSGHTIHQVVTLASIVEREAVLQQERPRVAGVFQNRVRAGMHLNADPTLQYALGHQRNTGTWWKKPLLNPDKTINSPYNTYVHIGLPPGPICNAGRASLIAAARPERTDYFYFVANEMRADGSHVFAKTLDEHERNRRQYQKSS